MKNDSGQIAPDMAAISLITGNLKWDGLHSHHLYYAAFAIFCGLFLSIIDSTICNVALPTMADQLGITSSQSIWVINSFQLIVVMTLLPFASIGEQKGYKRLYVWGTAIFTVGSLLCALSESLSSLVISRIIQGLGSAMMMSINPSLVRIIYPKRLLGRGLGLNATVIALASVAGPSLSAAILSVASWPWLFAINIPLGIVTFVLAWKFLPDNPVHIVGQRFKWKEAVLNIATFGLLIGSLEAYSHDVKLQWIFIGLAIFIIVGYSYVKIQLDEKYPILPFDLLRIPIFSMSIATSILSFMAQMLGLVAMPFMLVSTFNFNPVETGLIMTAWPLVIVIVGPVAGFLIGKIHSGLLGGIGLAILGTGCFLLAFIPAGTGYAGIIWRLMLCGMGFGMFQSPNNHLIMTSGPTQRAGSAGGMQATARLTGQTVGAALVALIFHVSGPTAAHDAMFVAGILAAAGAVCSLLRLEVKNSPSHD